MWDAKIPERNIHAALFCNTWLEYAKYIIKGEKDIKKNHDYTILRQVFDMARDHGGDDWVEDKFYCELADS